MTNNFLKFSNIDQLLQTGFETIVQAFDLKNTYYESKIKELMKSLNDYQNKINVIQEELEMIKREDIYLKNQNEELKNENLNITNKYKILLKNFSDLKNEKINIGNNNIEETETEIKDISITDYEDNLLKRTEKALTKKNNKNIDDEQINYNNSFNIPPLRNIKKNNDLIFNKNFFNTKNNYTHYSSTPKNNFLYNNYNTHKHNLKSEQFNNTSINLSKKKNFTNSKHFITNNDDLNSVKYLKRNLSHQKYNENNYNNYDKIYSLNDNNNTNNKIKEINFDMIELNNHDNKIKNYTDREIYNHNYENNRNYNINNENNIYLKNYNRTNENNIELKKNNFRKKIREKIIHKTNNDNNNNNINNNNESSSSINTKQEELTNNFLNQCKIYLTPLDCEKIVNIFNDFKEGLYNEDEVISKIRMLLKDNINLINLFESLFFDN